MKRHLCNRGNTWMKYLKFHVFKNTLKASTCTLDVGGSNNVISMNLFSCYIQLMRQSAMELPYSDVRYRRAVIAACILVLMTNA